MEQKENAEALFFTESTIVETIAAEPKTSKSSYYGMYY